MLCPSSDACSLSGEQSGFKVTAEPSPVAVYDCFQGYGVFFKKQSESLTMQAKAAMILLERSSALARI